LKSDFNTDDVLVLHIKKHSGFRAVPSIFKIQKLVCMYEQHVVRPKNPRSSFSKPRFQRNDFRRLIFAGNGCPYWREEKRRAFHSDSDLKMRDYLSVDSFNSQLPMCCPSMSTDTLLSTTVSVQTVSVTISHGDANIDYVSEIIHGFLRYVSET
jgi:hypothetical protein